jgi:hypothetical protein
VFYRVLKIAVSHKPVRYQGLIANPKPRAMPPTPPPHARGHPPILKSPPADRPWRTV